MVSYPYKTHGKPTRISLRLGIVGLGYTGIDTVLGLGQLARTPLNRNWRHPWRDFAQ